MHLGAQRRERVAGGAAHGRGRVGGEAREGPAVGGVPEPAARAGRRAAHLGPEKVEGWKGKLAVGEIRTISSKTIGRNRSTPTATIAAPFYVTYYIILPISSPLSKYDI